VCSNEKKIDGYFLDEANKLFKKCDISCKSCKSNLICLACDNSAGYFHLEDETTGN